MENTNPTNDNPSPAWSKRRWIAIITLIILLVVVLVLGALSYFSSWKCADGVWIRDGFPLSGEPKGGCQKAQKLVQPAAKTPDVAPQETPEIPAVNEFEAYGIRITKPKVGELIESPLIVEGEARGTWYFEGDFPVKILDENGSVLAYGYASHTSGEWMTENYVPFRGEVKFSNPNSAEGFVVFSQDDPSGMSRKVHSVSIPVKFGKATDEASGKNFLESKCGHDPMNDPILGDCGEDCNTENWKVYKSKKYGYSFRYPADYELTSSCKNNACVSEEESGDSVYMTGEHIVADWPLLYVRHMGNEPYNPPAQTDIPGWIQKKFSWTEKCFPGTENIYFPYKDGQMVGGFNIFFPRSPQAYARREIFYELNGKIFQIEMIDVDSPQARQFYNIWLSTFRVDGEK